MLGFYNPVFITDLHWRLLQGVRILNMVSWSPTDLRHHEMKTAKQHNTPLIGDVTLSAPSPAPKSPSEMIEQAARNAGMDRLASLIVQESTDIKKLNKTERAFYDVLLSRGYRRVGVQDITLKLADDTRYTPDFSAIGPNAEMIFFEVKGFFRDDAKVKLKVAARQHSWAQFYLVKKVKKFFEETPVNP